MTNLLRIQIDEKRVYGLDILRALAILFVVIGHGGYLLPERARKLINLLIFDGVSIFFVLSGFLIGGIFIKLIQEKGLNFKVLTNFWMRRWFRTLPNYYLILIILFVLHYLFRDGFTFRSVNRYFFFSQNLFSEHPAEFFPEAWSLSIEEWFYLITPLVIGFFTLGKKISYKQGVMISAVFILLLVTGFRFYRFNSLTVEGLGQWDVLFRKQVITRLDSLMYGVLGAYFAYYFRENWLKRKKELLIIGLIIVFSVNYVIPRYTAPDGMYNSVFSFSLMSIGTLLLLPYLSELKRGSGSIFKALTYVSLISYSMYLLNLSLLQIWIINSIPFEMVTDHVVILAVTKYGLYWFLLIVMSILLYKYYEVPMTKLRERFPGA
jgi:peptidoglycan/LPS O-acetylase OafA/YrhL